MRRNLLDYERLSVNGEKVIAALLNFSRNIKRSRFE